MNAESLVIPKEEAVRRTFIAQVYAWVCFALVISALVALFAVSSPRLISAIVLNSPLMIGIFIGELLLVIYITRALNRISASAATFAFFVFSMLNGFTLSILFLAFTAGSIVSTFAVTAGTFGAMSVYGFVTKRNLASWGNLLLMGLLGLIIASLVNVFLRNERLYWVSTYAGILIFIGLTAYDTQKIKNINTAEFAGADNERKAALFGALTLYLDFINLFIYLLRFLGKKR